MIWTVGGDGGREGAVYAPLGAIVPQTPPAQPAPETLHETARLGFEFAAGVRVAVKVVVLPALTDEDPVTAKENVLVIVIAPVLLFDGSATLIAVRVTFGGAVRICGAVYIPEELAVPHAAPTHPLPDTIQVTARLGLPVEFTVAEKGLDAPSSTGIDTGETETEMSLAIVTRAVPLFERSAALVASTVTTAG
jgi:hypothetical protein